MKFDELDAKMRVFETANDRSVLPAMFIVARIDGRNFTRLTKDVQNFEAITVMFSRPGVENRHAQF